ncbi:hypothetical protein GG344DRAFT_80516 [Lentinula edodes]|nr:hypothetical protein GG344DRAFT_80516 [Lentinula edodes]
MCFYFAVCYIVLGFLYVAAPVKSTDSTEAHIPGSEVQVHGIWLDGIIARPNQPHPEDSTTGDETLRVLRKIKRIGTSESDLNSSAGADPPESFISPKYSTRFKSIYSRQLGTTN